MIKISKKEAQRIRDIPVQRAWDDINREQPTKQWGRKIKKYQTLLDKIVNKLSK